MFLSEAELTLTEQITPYLPILGTIVGALVVGAFALWNRKRGATESKTPTVSEIWAREERVHRYARRLERLVDLLHDAFRGYVIRVTDGGDPTPTPEERIALDAEPPSIDQ